MIEHASVQDKLFAYLDHELDDAERAQIEKHLASCAACAEELEITRRANDLFDAIEPQPLPAGFMTRLQARIAEEDGQAEAAPSRPPLSIVPPPVPTPATPPQAALAPTVMAPSAPPPPQARRGGLRMLMLLAALLAAIVGITVLLRPSDEENPALAPAALAYSEGDIELQRGSRAMTVTQAMALRPGDAVVTAANARAVVTLGNGGSVRLAPSSRMRVVALATSAGSGRLDAKLELEEGAIWVEEVGGVHCALQAGSTLIVPVGTAYEAVLNNGAALVNVWEGKVQLSSLSDLKGSDLVAGQQAFISKGLVRLEAINAKTALANAFTEWNLRLQRPAHPSASGPLLRPTLVQTAVAPKWVDNPPPAPSPQSRVSAPATPLAAATPAPLPRQAAAPYVPVATTPATPAADRAPADDGPRGRPATPSLPHADQPRAAVTQPASGPAGTRAGYPSGPILTGPTPAQRGPRVVYATPPAPATPWRPAATARPRVSGARPSPASPARSEATPPSPAPHPSPRWSPQAQAEHPHPRWSPQTQAEHPHQGSPQAQTEHPHARWSPQAPSEHRRPRWTPQAQADHPHPRWSPQARTDTPHPRWTPQPQITAQPPVAQPHPQWTPQPHPQWTPQSQPQWTPPSQAGNPRWNAQGASPRWQPQHNGQAWHREPGQTPSQGSVPWQNRRGRPSPGSN